MENGEIKFFKENDENKINNEDKWKILVVDDSKDVQHMTELVFEDFTFSGKSLEIMKAHSEDETKNILRGNNNISVIFMDIVMENNDSGLRLIDYIRNELKNNIVRIIIRTGHPGEALEENVFDKYNISDYKEKNELSSLKMHTCLKAALRNYMDIKTIEENKKEKEILLKEIHHRVKNNLQIIISLIRLQIMNIEDNIVKNYLQDMNNRIFSMALIHEELYKSASLLKLDFQLFLNKLIFNIFKTYNFNYAIEKNIEIEEIYVGIDIAIPLGLIVNELVSNAIKYAFKEKNEGQISIKLKKTNDNILELNISDNGVGLSKSIDMDNVETLGLNLVSSLVRQLNGKININTDKGTHYKITIPI